MRLWFLHPRYLDTQGLVALWREGLLAQKVLLGKTKGYRNHPQLIRFKEYPNPLQAIADYLHGVCDEADQRGYSFARKKILCKKHRSALTVKVTKGQLAYETMHLKKKLEVRDKIRYQEFSKIQRVGLHPIFKLIPGKVADWEMIL